MKPTRYILPILAAFVLSPFIATIRAEFNLPVVHRATARKHQVVVAQGTDTVYQGHPTTVLMPDGKTMFCVWTIGHGGACGPLKRSDDGGLTWSDLIKTPDSWRSVKNCPTIWRLADPQGRARLIVYAGSGQDGNMHRSVSLDDGKTWSEMQSLGLGPSVMPFTTIEPINGGKALLGMTNIRRPGETVEKNSNIIVQSISTDGGMTWEPWKTTLDLPGLKPCEPWLIRSPDGKQLFCFLRENKESVALQIMSSDEGLTWTKPVPLPSGLRGDRHVAKYLPDGRLVVCFRDKEKGSPTRNHFVAWVGRYEDIVAGKESGYRIKLLHSYKGADCGYPSVEILPDGTVVATTYIKYRKGPEKNSVVSARFKVSETDAKLQLINASKPKAAQSSQKAAKPSARAASLYKTKGDAELFIDDTIIASSSQLERVFHKAAKLDKPVLQPEKPWEQPRVYLYGSVHRDPVSGKFRMWYGTTTRGGGLCYAESDNGVDWTRPNVGLHEFEGSKKNNILLPTMGRNLTVFVDENSPEPDKKYKALSGHLRYFRGAYSADGIHWKMYNNGEKLIPFGSELAAIARDDSTGDYLSFVRFQMPKNHPKNIRERRICALTTSRDFVNWNPMEITLEPDDIDDLWAISKDLRTEFYGWSGFKYGSQWLGFLTVMRLTGTHEKKAPMQAIHDGLIDVQLIHSRDGRAWQRTKPRDPVIANGPHDYDAGTILHVANNPIVVGDEVWLYYTAINTTHGATVPPKHITIALAKWRLDGFASLRAHYAPGVIQTVPMVANGGNLVVNADMSRGKLAIAVLNADGQPIPGFTEDDCEVVGTDSIRHRIKWKGGEQVPSGEAFSLRFRLTNGDLYSFHIAPSA